MNVKKIDGEEKLIVGVKDRVRCEEWVDSNMGMRPLRFEEVEEGD